MTSPFLSNLVAAAPAVSTAGNSQNTVTAIASRDGVVASVTYTPITAITGANTNTRSVSLVNKGNAGAGTNVIATLQFNSGVNASACVPVAVPLSGTPANLVVAPGDVLQWQSTAVGTGIADPGGLVVTTTSAKYA